MAGILVVLIILGCAVYQYLKGTLVKSFATIIITFCASVVAFGYFELLAKLFIDRNLLAPWAQMLSFVLLFVLTFAILQTIATQLIRRPIDLGLWPERIGRAVCGIFLGLILSGLLLTALAMAPLSNNKLPYQRFDQRDPDAERPNKTLLNADGFATGWFNMVSSSSFSGKRSFAVLHPGFVDQLFLNRHSIDDGISIITSPGTIKVPGKAAWPAPEGLKDESDQPVPQKDGHNLTIVRIGITTKAIKAGAFTFSQLRLVCKRKSDRNRLAGKGKNVYPIGYLKRANQLRIKRLNERIKLERDDFNGTVRWIDFAFYVPDDFVPILVEFKQNEIAQLPPPVAADQAPLAAPFIQISKCATGIAELEPITSARIYGVQLATGPKFLAESTLKISDANQWQSAQTARSIKPAQFKNGQINYVRAELKIEKPAEEKPKEELEEEGWGEEPKSFRPGSRKARKKGKGIGGMLERPDGYKLLSLRCNNPSIGAAIGAGHLPVLVDLAGSIHHCAGVIASGEVGGQTVYEVDYCSLTAEDIPGLNGLIVAEDGSIAKPFPDTVWLAEQAQSITEFYVLYLVKSDRGVIITAVRPGGSQAEAGFKGYEGFSTK